MRVFTDQANLFSAVILKFIGFGEVMMGAGAISFVIGSALLGWGLLKNKKNEATELGNNETKLSVPKANTSINTSAYIKADEKSASAKLQPVSVLGEKRPVQENERKDNGAVAKMVNKDIVSQKSKTDFFSPTNSSQGQVGPQISLVSGIAEKKEEEKSNPEVALSVESSKREEPKLELNLRLEDKKEELDPRLLTYILNTRVAGFKDDDIVQALKDVGWSDAIIVGAMKK